MTNFVFHNGVFLKNAFCQITGQQILSWSELIEEKILSNLLLVNG